MTPRALGERESSDISKGTLDVEGFIARTAAIAFDADSGVYTQRHVGTAPAVGTLATIRRSTSGLLGKVNINSAADIQTMLANSDQVCQQ